MREGGNEMREGGNEMREGGNEMREGGNEMREGGNEMREGGNEMREGGEKGSTDEGNHVGNHSQCEGNGRYLQVACQIVNLLSVQKLNESI